MLTKRFFIYTICLIILILTNQRVFASEISFKPFSIKYSIKKGKTGDRSVKIKTGIAEYFKSKSGNDLLYLVFYPYGIEPVKWRDIYKYKKTDPNNYVVIKIEVKGTKQIREGVYHTFHTSCPDEKKLPYFIPTIETVDSKYSGTTGKGKLEIRKMNLNVDGVIEGYIDYKDENFSVKGQFRAVFIIDK